MMGEAMGTTVKVKEKTEAGGVLRPGTTPGEGVGV